VKIVALNKKIGFYSTRHRESSGSVVLRECQVSEKCSFSVGLAIASDRRVKPTHRDKSQGMKKAYRAKDSVFI
jgi:hypothetical protein